VGRALRPSPGKRMGYVIVPILHDAKAKPEKILESEEFQEILTTLRALASNDDRIIEYFRAIANGKKRPSGGSVTFDIDERIAKKIDLDQFIRDIDLKCWHRLAKLSWRPFEEAREFVRGVGLKSQNEWRDYSKGALASKGLRPIDIPTNPHVTYKITGWDGYGDWLGTGTIAPRLIKYRPFEVARVFAHNLKLKSQKEWRSFCKGHLKDKGELPSDIPANPHVTYANEGWKSLGDWLGTGIIAPRLRSYRDFSSARAFAQSLELKSTSDWNAFCHGKLREKGNLPPDIPARPNQTYISSGWKGIGDWLGTGAVASRDRNFRSFYQARRFVRGLKLKSETEWRSYRKGVFPEKVPLPSDIPADPAIAYSGKGWISMGDWLGSGRVSYSLKKYRPFIEARGFARSLKLRSRTEWESFCQGKLSHRGLLPSDIPANPNLVYKNSGWIGNGDWLGTGNIANRFKAFLPFDDARSFAQRLGLKKQQEWQDYCAGKLSGKIPRPTNIPTSPNTTYKGKGWSGYGDWLGTGVIAARKRSYRSFKDARSFAQKLNLKNREEWITFCKNLLPEKGCLPADIPKNPDQTYRKKGWSGIGDWLGTGNISNCHKIYLPFMDARSFVHRLKLRNNSEWRSFCKGNLPDKGKLPSDIPANPNSVYSNEGWVGYGDWLGTGVIAASKRSYKPFKEARSYVHTLGLQKTTEWFSFCLGKISHLEKKPEDIPANPPLVYKNKGWIGFGDWLGTGRTSRTHTKC